MLGRNDTPSHRHQIELECRRIADACQIVIRDYEPGSNNRVAVILADIRNWAQRIHDSLVQKPDIKYNEVLAQVEEHMVSGVKEIGTILQLEFKDIES